MVLLPEGELCLTLPVSQGTQVLCVQRAPQNLKGSRGTNSTKDAQLWWVLNYHF